MRIGAPSAHDYVGKAITVDVPAEAAQVAGAPPGRLTVGFREKIHQLRRVLVPKAARKAVPLAKSRLPPQS